MKPLLKALAATAVFCLIIICIVFTVAVMKVALGMRSKLGADHVAVLDLKGVILSSSGVLKELDELTQSESLKAVVVRIDSPGGLVGPSQEYFEALKKLDKKMPVVISMGSVAASGGYYAALGGRKIFANPGTLTASIGVIMEFANTEKLYKWAKVDRYTLKAGKLKDIGTSLRPMTAEERAVLNSLLVDIHDQFKLAVKERRKLSDKEVAAAADGRIMTGLQAKTARLVDSLGGLDVALSEAKKLAGLPEDAYVHHPEPKKGLLEKYVLGSYDSKAALQNSQLFGRFLALVEDSRPLPLATGWNIMLLAPLR